MRVVGVTGLMDRPWLDHLDIGFAFLQPYCGRGLGTETSRAIIDCARSSLHLPRILGIVSPHNTPSHRLLLRLGFRRDSTIDTQPGDPVDLYILDLVPPASLGQSERAV